MVGIKYLPSLPLGFHVLAVVNLLETATTRVLYLLVDVLHQRGVESDKAVHFPVLGDLGGRVGHVGFKLEVCKVGDVVEGHLLDFKFKPSLASAAAERSLAESFSLVNFEFSLVALFFHGLSLEQRHSVGIGMSSTSPQLERVETHLLSKPRNSKRLKLNQGRGRLGEEGGVDRQSGWLLEESV